MYLYTAHSVYRRAVAPEQIRSDKEVTDSVEEFKMKIRELRILRECLSITPPQVGGGMTPILLEREL